MTDQEQEGIASKRALDLAAVWNRGVAMLRDNAQLIAIIAGVFVLLPNAALQFTLPADAQMQGPLEALLNPGASESMQQKAARTLGELLAPFFMFAALSVVVSHLGYAGIVALIGRARPTVGEALAQALRVVLPLLLALIIVFVTINALLALVQIALSPLGAAAATFLGAMLSVLALFYFTARFALTLPVMVMEWQLNPVKALLRSWRLTAVSAGNVFGFWMLLAVAWFVTLLIQVSVSAVISSVPGPGPTASLIQGLLGGLFAMVWGAIYCAMGVSLYTELKGPDADEIATEFD